MVLFPVFEQMAVVVRTISIRLKSEVKLPRFCYVYFFVGKAFIPSAITEDLNFTSVPFQKLSNKNR